MKKLLNTLWLIVLCSIAFNVLAANDKKVVLITQVVEHPALNKTTQGIIDGLAESGFIKDKNLTMRVESAQANIALASQIANKYIGQNPDVLVGVGTMAAQSFVKYTNTMDAKLVFSSITDPVTANLATNKAQMKNITGVANFIAIAPQIELIQSLQPKLQKIGIIYNPAEMNAQHIIVQLEKVCTAKNIKLHKQAITKTADAAQAATKLATMVDAIFISNDNTALSSLQSIVRAALIQKVPVYVSDVDAIAQGAIAALGPNQYALGKQTGFMLAKILQGQDINKLAIEWPNSQEIGINLAMAKQLGIVVPESVKKNAVVVVD